MTTTVTARVDFENNAEEFWTAFRDRIASLDAGSDLAQHCSDILARDVVELDSRSHEEFAAILFQTH